MNQILALLFPSSLGTMIYLKNASLKNACQIILNYMINTLLTNTIIYTIYYYIFNIKKFSFTNIFMLKYILISSIISIFIGILLTIINNRLNLKIEVEKNEKRVKTKKSTKDN